ncbi:MAG: transcription elongation factor GreA, partial [Deltaproteobacteria bacterium]|nr:transcription elongation factor GreA [Deltaproteobacteria bacterium]
NAEYEAAKEKQSQIIARIAEVEDKLARAQVIDPASLKSDKIVFGATVRLLDINIESEVVYKIVGEDESNVKEGRISVQSAIAKCLIGKQVSDIATLNTARGTKELEVLEIRFE